jgi:pyruvate formate lyase activating enzyme
MSALISTSDVRYPIQINQLPRRMPKVGGVTPFSATDYPGKLAAVIFIQGCPWRCGYCHNPHLQVRTGDSTLRWQQVMDLLRRRVGLIDAVVFSGGEPTTDPALADAIRSVKDLGFEIGLHTAGAYPKRLTSILPLLDWVGIDVKAPFEHYEQITGVAGSGAQARACVEAVIASGVRFECRTTIHPGLLPEGDILALARTLAGIGVKDYALQLFRAIGCNDSALNAGTVANYPGEQLQSQVAGLFPRFTMRRA